VAGERLAGGWIDDRPAERREVAAALGRGRHGGVDVGWRAGVIAGVVDEEERLLIRDDSRNRQWSADGGSQALLEVRGIRRRLSVEREGRRVERGAAQPVERRSADLIGAQRPAESAGAASWSAWSWSSAAEALTAESRSAEETLVGGARSGGIPGTA